MDVIKKIGNNNVQLIRDGIVITTFLADSFAVAERTDYVTIITNSLPVYSIPLNRYYSIEGPYETVAFNPRGMTSAILATVLMEQVFAPSFKNPNLGKVSWGDTEYTESAPFNVGTSFIPLPNNGAIFENISAPKVGDNWYQGGRIIPDNPNKDGFLARFSMQGNPTTNNRSVFLKIEIGLSKPISEAAYRFPVNASVDKPITLLMFFYAGALFYANGGEVLIKTDGNVGIYDIELLLHKIEEGR